MAEPAPYSPSQFRKGLATWPSIATGGTVLIGRPQRDDLLVALTVWSVTPLPDGGPGAVDFYLTYGNGQQYALGHVPFTAATGWAAGDRGIVVSLVPIQYADCS